MRVHARPRVGDRVDRRRGRRRPATGGPRRRPGPRRDAPSALAALVRDAGGDPDLARHRPRRPRRARRRRCATRSPRATSSSSRPGSSVGARDETAAVVAGLGEPGIWAHGIALRPGKPTLLADCGGVPVIGLPGNPRSALVVFRLIGMPIVRLVGGVTRPPPEPSVRARLERDVPSAAGRLDVVQVAVRDGVAAPLFGASALLSILTRRRRLHRRPRRRDRAAGGHRGRRHAVHLGRPRDCGWPPRPFIHDVPAAEALAAWRAACAAAGCPERVEAVRLGLHEAVGRVTAEPVWATRSSPSFDASAMDGIAVRAGRHGRREREHAGVPRPGRLRRASTPATRCPTDFDAVVMREHVHYDDAGARRAARRRRALPARALDRRGRQRRRAAAARGPPPARGRRRRRGGRRAPIDVLVRRRPVVAVLPTGDEIRPVGTDPAPGVILDTNSLMLAAQAEAVGLRGACARRDRPRRPRARSRAAVRDAAARADLVIVVAGSSAGRDDHTAAVVERLGDARRPRRGGPARATRSCSARSTATPVLGAPGYPVSAALTFDIFAAPLLAGARGRGAGRAPAGPGAARAQARVVDGHGRLGARAARARRRRARGDAAAARRRRAHLARARRRPARRPRRARGPPRRRARSTSRCCAGVGEIDRTIVAIGSHDLVLDLAASELRAARPRRHARVLERRLARRARRAARRAVPHRRLAPARSRDRRVHACPTSTACSASRDVAVVRLVASRAGADRGAAATRWASTGIEDLARPGLRYVNRQRGAGTRVLLDHELGRRGIAPDAIDGLRARGAHAPRGRRRGRRGPRRRRPRRAGRRARVRPRLRARHPRALRPRAGAGRRSTSPPSRRSGRCSRQPAFRAAVEALGGYGTQEMGRRIR